mmetsp:Transcript_41818/g.97365  ORF Transcript_41818/g.97365 Transcript_41818/m.97365 type:complete len:232 (-) Transcript_41818:453-1148(-)
MRSHAYGVKRPLAGVGLLGLASLIDPHLGKDGLAIRARTRIRIKSGDSQLPWVGSLSFGLRRCLGCGRRFPSNHQGLRNLLWRKRRRHGLHLSQGSDQAPVHSSLAEDVPDFNTKALQVRRLLGYLCISRRWCQHCFDRIRGRLWGWACLWHERELRFARLLKLGVEGGVHGCRSSWRRLRRFESSGCNSKLLGDEGVGVQGTLPDDRLEQRPDEGKKFVNFKILLGCGSL